MAQGTGETNSCPGCGHENPLDDDGLIDVERRVAGAAVRVGAPAAVSTLLGAG